MAQAMMLFTEECQKWQLEELPGREVSQLKHLK
jgi:hypothetical protein